LLSHQIPDGDPAAVLHHALERLVRAAEKRKFAESSRAPRAPRPTRSPRHIPAHVKRAVAARDVCRCTFVGEDGHRCGSRTRLEYDHIVPVARGGESTVANLRLRCRAHNQFEAERTFGADFMEHRREQAKNAATRKAAEEVGRDVLMALRNLGYRAGEARRAIEHGAELPDASLEARLRDALAYLRPPARTEWPGASGAAAW
jgi:5-methylcytosine-specific restriction endonuclease McrA